MLHLQIPLSCLRIFHHDSSYQRVSTSVTSPCRVEEYLLMFGKPLVGNAMAAEHINAELMTSKFG